MKICLLLKINVLKKKIKLKTFAGCLNPPHKRRVNDSGKLKYSELINIFTNLPGSPNRPPVIFKLNKTKK